MPKFTAADDKEVTETTTTYQEYTLVRKVKVAFLQQAVTWPGIMPSELSLSATRLPGLSITLITNPDGLLLEKKGRQGFVASANVSFCEFE